MTKITVIKQNPEGQETWRYPGVVLEHGENYLMLEARFNGNEDVEFHGLSMKVGDRFVETFYVDRWYNIIEVHDREDDRFKGWYCNIAMPAIICEETVSYRDLALDLIVLPNGRQFVLDQDEFAELALTPYQRDCAQNALKELIRIFDRGDMPSPLSKAGN